MPSKLWLKSALTRAVKTAAQTAAAMLSVGVFIEDINWIAVLSSSLLAAILSVLTSLAGLPEVNNSDES